eukprot:TRINITY_DN212_c0_g2_i1.p1 TRINITY_DN212_c0_g2~~TRINITY_DN212_c0_g2_i1.p1  ORF type:complete len:191 (+),score=59.16 TRINITY_DN212_c0_g2_i1:118-690(+)
MNLKIYVVGDVGVGKTCLLISYATNEFPEDYVPDVFSNWDGVVDFEGKNINLILCDTSAKKSDDRIRTASYSSPDVFFACFSIDSPDSLENVKTKWVPEINYSCPEAPIILVGTKLDLREDYETIKSLEENNLEPITYQQGSQMAKKINSEKYIECSALTQENLKQTFDEAFKTVLKKDEKKKKKICVLL